MLFSRPDRALSGALCAIAAIGVTACSGGGGGSSPVSSAPPPIVVTRSFPAGDAIAAGGGTAWDIVGVKTTLFQQFHGGNGQAYDTLRVDVTFNQDVSNALPGFGVSLSSPTQLGVSIGLDSDGNPATGSHAGCKGNLTPFDFGSQASDRLSDGNYSIYGSNGPIYSGPPNPPAEAVTATSGTTLSQSFYLTSIGVAAGSLVPTVNIDVIAINGSTATSQITDCVPTDGTEMATKSS